MEKDKPKISPDGPAANSPIKIEAAKIREGSWKLWEWLDEEMSIEFIDEKLIEILPIILGEIIILHRREVGL